MIEQEGHWRGADPANFLVVDPGPKGLIPKEGAWIMITRQLPPMEYGMAEKVRVGCVFWAVHGYGTDEQGFDPSGKYKVKLTTEWGDVYLWPYEYSRMDPEHIVRCWADEELIFHPMRMDAATLNSQTFYARSRGIPLAAATVMSLGTLSANVGWFEIRPDLREMAEGLEERIHRWQPSRRRSGKPMKVNITVKEDHGEPSAV